MLRRRKRMKCNSNGTPRQDAIEILLARAFFVGKTRLFGSPLTTDDWIPPDRRRLGSKTPWAKARRCALAGFVLLDSVASETFWRVASGHCWVCLRPRLTAHLCVSEGASGTFAGLCFLGQSWNCVESASQVASSKQ